MSLRISSLSLLAVLIPACAEPSGEPEGAMIACAIGPGADFSEVCTLERVSADLFVIHHPGGGFRRFNRSADAGEVGLEPADGAEQLIGSSITENGEIDFTVGQERYRLNSQLLAAPAGETVSDD